MARILVIDDDAQVRSFVRRILESEGHTIQEARDGAEGLKCYGKSPADLIISDIFMPEKEGLEVIRELSRKSRHVKIIVMSGGASKFPPAAFLEVAKKLGATSTLVKPFSPEELMKLVKQVLLP